MGQAIAVRRDYTSGKLRRLARRTRRRVAIAAVFDGASREEAAEIGGMDRQTLRDWVIRFNEQGPDGLINIPSPGAPPKLDDMHKAFLRRIVDEGPIPAVHGVVRWRASDLIMRLYEEFGLSVSDDTIYRALKNLGFSHVSARPPTEQLARGNPGLSGNFGSDRARCQRRCNNPLLLGPRPAPATLYRRDDLNWLRHRTSPGVS